MPESECRAAASFALGVTLGLLPICLAPPAAHAVLDISDRGPVLGAGAYALRVTNAGILGNAFYVPGLCFDPSFEFPKGSGHEALNHAELWVGAVTPEGHRRVSGGPMLEWRPTLDPSDRVRIVTLGDSTSRRMFSHEAALADFTDDTPQAVNYAYSTGESHEPLGLSAHQEVYAWSLPGLDRVAGVQLTVTNHGAQTLGDVYLAVYADLDSRGRDDPVGQLNDRVTSVGFSRFIDRGVTVPVLMGAGLVQRRCSTLLERTVPVVEDVGAGGDLPMAALLPLGHTLDPWGLFARQQPTTAVVPLHAPAEDSFRFTLFRQDQPPGQGGPPVLDADRYAALVGDYPAARADQSGDYAVLLSCGPFPLLEPGRSVEFALALVVGPAPESLSVSMGQAAVAYDGQRLDLLPDTTGAEARYYYNGATGINGHEVCLEPPPGITFLADPNCPNKFPAGYYDIRTGFAVDRTPDPVLVTYAPGHCVWTDADCDGCTGDAGRETVQHWADPGSAPLNPAYHVSAGDHGVRIAWDNTPEILLNRGLVSAGYHFTSYRVYKLSRWQRRSEVPSFAQWDMLREFGLDTLHAQTLLSSITDSSLAPDGLLQGQPHYPIGRYAVTDGEVLNGFGYIYVVTTVAEKTFVFEGVERTVTLESPIMATLDSVVVPHVTAAGAGGRVWVVPNPYRARAPWERPPVPGDALTRHIDFFGLPRAPARVRIYTVAGDFVAEVDHDGSNGDGQASWDLISRNGQDVESGIYIFTVESRFGHQTGRFVVIR